MRYGEAFLAQTFQTVSCNALHPVEARRCRWILSMHDRADGDTLPLTHEFLAEMLGVQRSSVSVVTRTLQTAGLIRQSRGSITVTDRAGLEEAACECYGRIRRVYQRRCLVRIPKLPRAKLIRPSGDGHAPLLFRCPCRGEHLTR
jgi:hypothetical protein